MSVEYVAPRGTPENPMLVFDGPKCREASPCVEGWYWLCDIENEHEGKHMSQIEGLTWDEGAPREEVKRALKSHGVEEVEK